MRENKFCPTTIPHIPGRVQRSGGRGCTGRSGRGRLRGHYVVGPGTPTPPPHIQHSIPKCSPIFSISHFRSSSAFVISYSVSSMLVSSQFQMWFPVVKPVCRLQFAACSSVCQKSHQCFFKMINNPTFDWLWRSILT